MLVSRTGRPTHRVLVRFQEHAEGPVYMPGEQVAYGGDPDWRFEPNAPGEIRKWIVSHGDPVRVAEFNSREEVTGPVENQ